MPEEVAEQSQQTSAQQTEGGLIREVETVPARPQSHPTKESGSENEPTVRGGSNSTGWRGSQKQSN
jgi:hypothetical protein